MRTTCLHKALLSAVACLCQAGALLAQHGIIKGRVSNSYENLPAATISLGNKTMLTDSKGEFSFLIEEGTYKLLVTHAGYKKIEDTVSVKAGSTQIFDYQLAPAAESGEVVVFGSRFVARTNLTSPVPVDAFSSAQLIQTGQISLTQMLNQLAPSFNASREVLNEPATLRGLDPQHVLILVNGKRYHNMAWLFSGGLKGQLGRGSVGNDLNSIPFAAIEKIEILRDGASAQYGSDAIAGVINIQLKKTTGKFASHLHGGQFYKGDGEKLLIGFNHGISLNKKGFLNFSATYRQQNPTHRGGEYDGTVYYDITNQAPRQRDSLLALDNQKVLESGFNRRKALDNIGNTKLVSPGFLVNGGYDFSKRIELYWTASVNSRRLERQSAYRFPKNKGQVNTALFPDGFKPVSKSNTMDVSAIAGLRGKTGNDWQWDFSSGYGMNSVSSDITNANNASQSYLGNKAPTTFYIGKDVYQQLTNGFNIIKKLLKSPGKIKAMNMAWGAEWRLESYRSMLGDSASWFNYDPQNYAQGGVGAPGPENVVSKSRNILGSYVELEGDLSDRFLLSLAGRYEYYSDYGGNIAAKLAARYKISEKFSARISGNNGFRAPSLQQIYLNSIQTNFMTSGGIRVPVVRGTFPNNHVVIKALDIPQLMAEKTINISGGFTATIAKHVNLTVDAYWIQIKDRIVLSGILDRSIPAVKKILDSIPGLRVDQVQFFTNAINTRTKGLDIILDGNWKIGKDRLGAGLGVNLTSTRLFGDIKTSSKLPADSLNTYTIFNIEEKTRVEKGQPSDKIILSVSYKTGKTMFIVRNTRFGATAIAPLYRNPTRIVYESFSPKILTDVSVQYSLKSWASITLGANNIFDVYPDPLKNYENTAQGGWIYSTEASPFGFNGGYYYLAMGLTF